MRKEKIKGLIFRRTLKEDKNQNPKPQFRKYAKYQNK